MARAFEDMGVCAELLRVVEEHDWLVPTPVQAEVIPLLLGGGDVLAAAETGSGKTGAFMLPMLQVIQETLLVPEPLDRPATDENTPKNGANGHEELRVAWNRRDMDAQLRVSDDGLCVSGRDAKRWLGARANTGVRSRGKYYFECEVTRCGANGIARVGWSTVAASLDLGMDRHGYGYGGTGKRAHAKQFAAYGEPFSQGDVIGCFLDLDSKRVWFSKNGVAFQADGFTLTHTSQATAYFPAVCVKEAVVTARFDGFKAENAVSPIIASEISAAGFESVVASKTIVRANDSTPSPTPQKGAAKPMGIVIEPSRDLAHQVFECAVAFKKYMATPSVRVSLCVGGGGANASFKIPASDLIVATPGRLLDLVKQRTLDLSRVQLLVLDEVDQLIATDAVPAIEKIHALILASQPTLQVSFFSATLHAHGVHELATKLCRRPLVVDLKGKDFIPETVHHAMVSLTADEMFQRLVQLSDVTATPPTDSVHTDNVKSLKGKLLDAAKSEAVRNDKEQLSLLIKLVKPMLLVEMLETLAIEQCMVFCRTNLDCDLLEKYLLRVGGGRGFASGTENPFSCCVLAGMRSMASRQQALEAFKLGEIRVLICTDVAARGIDVPQLACVVNMTLPDTEENYIHRVGRVGRNGHLGLAISLVAGLGVQEKVWFHQRNCKKPRGVGCENRKLLDKGGCTIWYNESALKSGIETRLGETVVTVESVVELNNTIDKRGGMMQYGRERSHVEGNVTQSARKELLQLAPHVKTLASLEDKVQIAWLELQQQLMAV